ncbi:STAS domain-containing protein [Streptomyces sp. NPDC091268]|uniref:STAS domain-containing protein n=1 Tax=Streptomyces sp. NPDC091268 TaxID=3365979 RepID=UPI0038114CCC
MSPLDITVRNTPAGPVVGVVGDLDYATAAELRDLTAALPLLAGQRLVLDLAGMEFCDSSGISALIAARNHALAAHAHIRLDGVPAHTLRVLRFVGLAQVFHLDTDPATGTGDAV